MYNVLNPKSSLWFLFSRGGTNPAGRGMKIQGKGYMLNFGLPL